MDTRVLAFFLFLSFFLFMVPFTWASDLQVEEKRRPLSIMVVCTCVCVVCVCDIQYLVITSE